MYRQQLWSHGSGSGRCLYTPALRIAFDARYGSPTAGAFCFTSQSGYVDESASIIDLCFRRQKSDSFESLFCLYPAISSGPISRLSRLRFLRVELIHFDTIQPQAVVSAGETAEV